MPDDTLSSDLEAEREVLLKLADAVDAWTLHPNPKSRNAVYAARDAVAKVRAKRRP